MRQDVCFLTTAAWFVGDQRTINDTRNQSLAVLANIKTNLTQSQSRHTQFRPDTSTAFTDSVPRLLVVTFRALSPSAKTIQVRTGNGVRSCNIASGSIGKHQPSILALRKRAACALLTFTSADCLSRWPLPNNKGPAFLQAPDHSGVPGGIRTPDPLVRRRKK